MIRTGRGAIGLLTLAALTLAGCGTPRPSTSLTSVGNTATHSSVPATASGPHTTPSPTPPAPPATGGGSHSVHTPPAHTPPAAATTPADFPSVDAHLDAIVPEGGPGNLACATGYYVQGTLTVSAPGLVGFVLVMRVNDKEVDRSPVLVKTFDTAGSQTLEYLLGNGFVSGDITMTFELQHPELYGPVTSNELPGQAECGATVTDVTVTTPTCGQTAAVITRLSIPLGPHVQPVNFRFTTGAVGRNVVVTYTFGGLGPQTADVAAYRLVVDPHKPITVTVSAPPYKTTVTKTLTCTTPTP